MSLAPYVVGWRRSSALIMGALLIIRRPVCTLAVVLLVTAGAALLATRVSFEGAIEVWFLDDDPALVTYHHFSDRFAAYEMVVLAIDADVFTPRMWDTLASLAQQVASVPHVHRVLSVLDFDLDPPLPFEAVTLEEQEIDWQARRSAAAAHPLVTPFLVAADGMTAALVAHINRDGNTVTGKQALVEALDAIIAQVSARSGITIYVTGTPVLDHRALVHNEHDLQAIYPFIAPCILLFCWGVFGSLRLAAMPLLVVAFSTIWAFGFMGLLNLKTTLLSSALVPLFLAIGVADSVHLLARFQRQRTSGSSVTASIEASLRSLWQPCLFTSITTGAGLCALLISDLRPVREFAMTAAIGVLAAFIMTMTLVPALLRLYGDHLSRARPYSSGTVRRIVGLLIDPPRVVKRAIIPVAVLSTLLSLWSASRIEVGVDPMSWFREGDPFRQATTIVDSRLGGATAVEFLVDAGPDGFADPDRLKAIDDFQQWLLASTPATGCVAVVDLLWEAARTVADDPNRVTRVPDSAFVTRALLDNLAERQVLDRWLAEDRRSGRISCRLPLSESADLGAALALVESEIARRFAHSPITVTPTGYGVLMVQMEHHLVQSQIRTLSAAFLVVLLMLALLVRSVALATVAMLPNLLPVLIGLGLMPVLGISLNPGTVMVAAVALGIIVDDTAHLLVAARRQLDCGHPVQTALPQAVREVGKPVLVTSLILAGSLGALMLGSFAPGMQFGAIASAIAIAALLCDLWLLPQLLLWGPITRWSKLTTGPAP